MKNFEKFGSKNFFGVKFHIRSGSYFFTKAHKMVSRSKTGFFRALEKIFLSHKNKDIGILKHQFRSSYSFWASADESRTPYYGKGDSDILDTLLNLYDARTLELRWTISSNTGKEDIFTKNLFHDTYFF